MLRSPSPSGAFALTPELKDKYSAALVEGDRSAAAAVVSEGLQQGLDVPSLLLGVLVPAQQRLGELWHAGEVSIAREHWGTQVTMEEIERVLHHQRPAPRVGRSVIVTTVPGEVHTLPARIMAGLLSWRGWSVDYLGSAPPSRDLLAYVVERDPDLIALSITMAVNRKGAVEVCEHVETLPSPPPVLVGGAGAAGLEAEELGAGAVAVGALEGLELAAKLVGLGSGRDLDSYLSLVGRRIQEHRRASRLSQSELARRSGLTRPYLSAVERGKQNITLEAALKIAGALEIAMNQLLDEGWR